MRAELHRLSRRGCSTIVLTTTKLGQLKLRRQVQSCVSAYSDVPTTKRKIVTVRAEASSSRAVRTVRFVRSRGITSYVVTRQTFLRGINSSYGIPTNVCTIPFLKRVRTITFVKSPSKGRVCGEDLGKRARSTGRLKRDLTRTLVTSNNNHVLRRLEG